VDLDTPLDITTIDNQVLIGDDGLNGPTGNTSSAIVEVEHPTDLPVGAEPGNIGSQSQQIFLPTVARNGFSNNGQKISLSVDQLMMTWVCAFMDNFGWTSDACYIQVEELTIE